MRELDKLGIPEILRGDMALVAMEASGKTAWLSSDELVVLYGCPHGPAVRALLLPLRKKVDRLSLLVGVPVEWSAHIWRDGLLWTGRTSSPWQIGIVIDEGERRAPLVAKLNSSTRKD